MLQLKQFPKVQMLYKYRENGDFLWGYKNLAQH